MQVTKDQAEKSRYFGFRGWLLFFYISSGVFGTITSGMNVIFPSSSNNLDYFGGDETVSRVVHLIYVLTTIPFLILAPIKHRWAPKLWLFSIWTNWIVFAIALDMPARNSFAFILIVLGLVSVLLMTWYILASKRINATYRHKIRPDKEAVSDAPGVKGENGQILKARQPRRWVLYAVGVPLSIVATLFLGAAFWGLYETNKHRFGDPVPAGVPIMGSQSRYSVTPPTDGWVRVKPGSIGDDDDADLEFYGPNLETWALVRLTKSKETTLNDIVVGRREAIAETTKKLTVSEERTMMAGHELPISFARYEDLAPIIGNGYVWWVAAIDTETIVIEVIAGTNRKKQFQAIEQFVRSLRLLKKATTS